MKPSIHHLVSERHQPYVGEYGSWWRSNHSAVVNGAPVEAVSLLCRERVMLTWDRKTNQVLWIKKGPYRRGDVAALNEALRTLNAPMVVTRPEGERGQRPMTLMIDWIPYEGCECYGQGKVRGLPGAVGSRGRVASGAPTKYDPLLPAGSKQGNRGDSRDTQRRSSRA